MNEKKQYIQKRRMMAMKLSKYKWKWNCPWASKSQEYQEHRILCIKTQYLVFPMDKTGGCLKQTDVVIELLVNSNLKLFVQK